MTEKEPQNQEVSCRYCDCKDTFTARCKPDEPEAWVCGCKRCGASGPLESTEQLAIDEYGRGNSAHEPLQRLQRPFNHEEAKAYKAFINEHFEAPHCSSCDCGAAQPPGDVQA